MVWHDICEWRAVCGWAEGTYVRIYTPTPTLIHPHTTKHAGTHTDTSGKLQSAPVTVTKSNQIHRNHTHTHKTGKLHAVLKAELPAGHSVCPGLQAGVMGPVGKARF